MSGKHRLHPNFVTDPKVEEFSVNVVSQLGLLEDLDQSKGEEMKLRPRNGWSGNLFRNGECTSVERSSLLETLPN